MSTASTPASGLHLLPTPEQLGEMGIRLALTIAVAFVIQRAVLRSRLLHPARHAR
jgi:hypothetical protein